LRILSIEYKNTIKHLEYVAKKGKQLLTLMEICHKYESEDKKVIPVIDCMKLEEPSYETSVSSEWNVSLQVNFTFEKYT